MTATYWEIGQQIVEYEQGGEKRAEYGKKLVRQLSLDLSRRFGRGFGVANLAHMRRFYLEWQALPILQTLSVKFDEPSSAESYLSTLARHFPLPWSHYVKLMAVKNPEARAFYEAEALRNGWSVRQVERQEMPPLILQTLSEELRVPTLPTVFAMAD